jgi:hypothetical protein
VAAIMARVRDLSMGASEAFDAIEAALAQPSEAQKDGAHWRDVLMGVAGRLELPRSVESGPPDDPMVYERAIDALEEAYETAEAERKEHAAARFKAEAALSSAKPGTVGGEVDASPIINAAEEYLRNALSPGTDDFAARALPSQEHGPAQGLGEGWRSTAERPDSDRKIIALFDDGSGANLFFTYESGLIDAEGTEYGWSQFSCYSHWTYLPDGFRLWCEDRDEDPYTFPAPSDSVSL